MVRRIGGTSDIAEQLLHDIHRERCTLTREPENLFFYRDKSQREVDVLRLLQEGSLEAYEIKAGMTFNTDYFKHLHYLQTLLGNQLKRTSVIYDGEQESQQPIDGYCNFRHLQLEQ